MTSDISFMLIGARRCWVISKHNAIPLKRSQSPINSTPLAPTACMWAEYTSFMMTSSNGNMFSLICVWINSWVNTREAGDLRRYRTHHDVIVMFVFYLQLQEGVVSRYSQCSFQEVGTLGHLWHFKRSSNNFGTIWKWTTPLNMETRPSISSLSVQCEWQRYNKNRCVNGEGVNFEWI